MQDCCVGVVVNLFNFLCFIFYVVVVNFLCTEVLVKAVMSLYEGSRTKVRVDRVFRRNLG